MREVLFSLLYMSEISVEIKRIATEYVDRGISLFKQGYNCSQSVAMVFSNLYGIDDKLMSRLIGSFGGGIGRMRETCGAACAIFMLCGLEVTSHGERYPDKELKKKNYEAVQYLAQLFREQTGSIVCKELLGLNKKRLDGTLPEITICATPEERTDEYYRKRPCIRMVETAIRIYIRYLVEVRGEEDASKILTKS